MRAPRPIRQSGYVLILVVLGLMGIGGVVLVGFTQGAKQEVDNRRYQHNQRVLEEAKQALLMYAYRYPEIAGPARGPGRLPCPDTDNTGTPNPDLVSFCIDNGTGEAMVGRFPWRANGMEFYDARDASGERLWYAVSQDFNFFDDASIVNSDLVGSITIHDQNGQQLYDGAADGIAAVIIAPGPPIDRNGVAQDRSVANGDDREGTVADTDPGIVDPVNYLDLFGALDNADFVNDDSNNGFVLGPIDDLAAEELIVNDQIILITSEEVIAMAQKATLQAYREALETYMNRPGFDRYPWLDPYDTAGALTTYDAEINPAPPAPVIGRMPSIFEPYFTISNRDSEDIISEVTLKFDVDGDEFESRAPASAAADVYFEQNTGDLFVPPVTSATFTGWAWDGHATNTPTRPLDNIWEACPYVTGTEDDCNQDSAGNFVGGSSSPAWLRVRKYTITFNAITGFPFADRTVTPVAYVPPSATSHAFVEAEFDGPGYIASISWEQDDEFQNSHTIEPPGNVGTLTYDAGDSIIVGIRYYPELPRWAQSNGWHNMVQAAYSSEVRPGGDDTCTAGIDCLTLQDIAGTTNDKRALLVLSGGVGDFDPADIDLIDDTNPGNPPYYGDELADIFEDENNDFERKFDNRPTTGIANDVVLLLE